MAEKMWMGIPTKHMQWVPCPLIDSGITRNRYVDRIQFENGGGDVARSNAYQMEYNFSFSGPAHELEGIDAFNKFASGYYGTGLMQVAHPATFETNMFPANWATPALAGEGWKSAYDGSSGGTNVSTVSVSKVNYIKNSNFEAVSYVPSANWSKNGFVNSYSIAATGGVSGGRALKVDTSSSNSAYVQSHSVGPFPAGKQITISAYVKTSLSVRFTASNLTAVSGTIDGSSTTVSANSITTPTDGAYHRISITGTATSASTVSIYFYNNSAAINTFYVDNVMLEESATLSDYFDGSTTDTSELDYAWTSPSDLVNAYSTASSKIIYPGVPDKAFKFTILSSVNTPVKKVTIPVPPGYTLHLGATGVSTGYAVVQVRPILVNNSYTTVENLTLLPYGGSSRYNKQYSGSTYNAVEVYLTRTSTASVAFGSTLTLACMNAQLYPTGSSPALPTYHIPGEGSTGMVFADDAIVETYSYMHPPRKGISTTMVEVEAWRQ